MALVSGYEGSVKIGTTVVGSVSGFTYSITGSEQDASVLGSEWEVTRVTTKNVSGSVTLRFDPSNSGQNQLSIGAALTLILLSTTGVQATGPAVVTEVAIDQSSPQTVVSKTISFKSTGAWTGV